MLLFTRENITKIILGDKTETRRVGERRWRLEAKHQIKAAESGIFGEPLGLVEILAVQREPLGDITDDGAKREGYRNRAQFFDAWRRLHGSLHLEGLVWVVRFKCVSTARREDGSWV